MSARRRGHERARWRGVAASVAIVTALVAQVLLVSPPAGAVTPWVVVATSAPVLAENSGVVCPGVGSCIDVDVTTTGVGTIRATFDAGASYRILDSLAPGTYPDSIACGTARDCVAVDGSSALVTLWTTDAGTTWSERALPPGIEALDAITCVSTHGCVGVGFDRSDDPVLVLTTDEGRSWVARTIPPVITSGLRDDDQQLVVACATIRLCVVAGQGADHLSFRTADDGRHWSERMLPQRFDVVGGISCTRTGRCAIVGGNRGSGMIATSSNVGATWTRSLWTRSVGPLSGVSCSARGACVAVGVDRARYLVVARPSGRGWRTVRVGATRYESGPSIGCATVATCEVEATATSGVVTTELSQNLGATWSFVGAQPAAALVESSSCPVAGICELVGVRGSEGFAEGTTTDGASWTVQTLPAGVQNLDSVTCGSATTCQAIGESRSLDPQALLGTSDGGTTWTAEQLPSGVLGLQAVACSSALTCVALGTTTQLAVVAIETTDGGTTWTKGTVSGVQDDLAEPTSVSCASSTVCVSGLFGVPGAGFLQTADGGMTWTFSPSPTSALSLASVPLEVACATSTQCVAAGTSLIDFSATPAITMMATSDGTTWSTQNVLGQGVAAVSPISCQSDGGCEMVGEDPSVGAAYLLTSTDAGMTWSAAQLPRTWLDSQTLSCTSATSCLSTGVLADGGTGIATS